MQNIPMMQGGMQTCAWDRTSERAAARQPTGQTCLPWQRRTTRRARGRYQRNSLGPSTAPASVHKAIVPPYQSATKGTESSTQCSA